MATCTKPDALTSIDKTACPFDFKQTVNIAIQRKLKDATTYNVLAKADIPLLATWTAAKALLDSEKVITVGVDAPESTPGAVRNFGGGNATKNGIEIFMGLEPCSFVCKLYDADPAMISALQEIQENREEVSVYLMDNNGRILCRSVDVTNSRGVEVQNFTVTNPKLGGYEGLNETDLNFKMKPDWFKTSEMIELAFDPNII